MAKADLHHLRKSEENQEKLNQETARPATEYNDMIQRGTPQYWLAGFNSHHHGPASSEELLSKELSALFSFLSKFVGSNHREDSQRIHSFTTKSGLTLEASVGAVVVVVELLLVSTMLIETGDCGAKAGGGTRLFFCSMRFS